MSPWAKKRKLIVYSLIIIILLFFIISYSLKKFLKAPTCFDNKQNGTEEGVDCGGTCSLICSTSFEHVRVSWSKSIEISGDIYNIAALVENINKNYELNFEYKFDIFSKKGNLIMTKSGKTKLLPQEKKVIFIPFEYLGDNKIKDTFFKVTKQQAFLNSKTDSSLSHTILSKKYEVNGSIPTLSIAIINNSTKKSKKLEVTGILYDENKNIINFSSSIIDPILPSDTKIVDLTWQHRFKKKVSTYSVYIHNIES